jgi:nitrogen-specific signal transduction histidine kinase
VLRDVTQERKREEDLRQAQKMEAVGQLTGGVAHDFNNLLTVILGSLEMLDLEMEETSPAKKLVADALKAAERGGALTHQLLAYSRRQSLRPRVLSLNQLLGDMDRLLRRTIPESIRIETVQDAGLWLCEADPTQLQNVILNLALNARDAMPEGGILTLETANARLDEEYTSLHEGLLPGQYVMVAVTDTGSGMDEGVIRQAFEPFFTTKEVGEGSGLGLSMVQGFLKQSGGHVKIYSEVGKGTTVKVYLPRVIPEGRGEEGLGVGLPEALPRGSGERILVVEDDDSVRKLACALLRDLSYKPTEVGDGPGALRILEKEGAGAFKLLFTDVILPGGMTGRELAIQVRGIDPELPVLYTSGYTENAIIHDGRLDAGVQLLEKPYRMEVLARRVRQILHPDG